MAKQGTGNRRIPTHPFSRYDQPFTFSEEFKPAEIGFYSLDNQRQFYNDRRQLRKYAPPENKQECNFDLRAGYSEMIKKNYSLAEGEYLDNLLRLVMTNTDRFRPTQVSGGLGDAPVFKSLDTDFLTSRGLLAKLLQLPHNAMNELTVAIIKFRGTYYMCDFDTQLTKESRERMTSEEERMTMWGANFDQYVTCDMDKTRPDISKPVDTNESFTSAVRSVLRSHSLVYIGQVDCVHPKDEMYVELKTPTIPKDEKQQTKLYRHKLFKWWAQSFLLNVPLVTCGFQDDAGVVKYIEEYRVADMPEMAMKELHPKFRWKPNVCFNFLDTVLSFIKENITDDNERAVYLLEREQRSDLTLDLYTGNDPKYHFLPDWFIKWDAWDRR